MMRLFPLGPPGDPGRYARRFTIAMLFVGYSVDLASHRDRQRLHAENEVSKRERAENRWAIIALAKRIEQLERDARAEP